MLNHSTDKKHIPYPTNKITTTTRNQPELFQFGARVTYKPEVKMPAFSEVQCGLENQEKID